MDSLAPVISALIAAAVTGLINWRATLKASGRMEGAVEQGLKSLHERLDRHEEEDRRQFNEVREQHNRQWKTIDRHTAEIGFLQGKTNGKAAGV